jgi:uncharacterized protein
MPVRSLASSVLAWPDARQVDGALRDWASRAAAARPELRRVGYFGSYARGDWGPGSDLDVILVVATAARPFIRRPIDWDLTPLPVPADVIVYTEDEWRALDPETRFGRTIAREAVWVYGRD